MLYTLITGGTGGIGKAFIYELANQKDNLIIVGRNSDKLNTLKSEVVSKYNINVLTFVCDLSSDNDRLSLYSQLKSDNIIIERVIFAHGVDTQMAFEKYTQDKLLFQLRVNYESIISLTNFLITNYNKLELLVISSMCASCSMPYFSLYASTKKALNVFFDGIREELKGRVKITVVMPGSVPTRPDIVLDIQKQGLTGKLSQKTPEYVAKHSLKALKKGKKTYIVGFYNRLVNFFSKITPTFIRNKIIIKKFKNKEKDAF